MKTAHPFTHDTTKESVIDGKRFLIQANSPKNGLFHGDFFFTRQQGLYVRADSLSTTETMVYFYRISSQDESMKHQVQYKKITWTNFRNPSSDDIEYLQENFNIHPTAIEEFITPTFRPKATHFDNCLFLTMHIPLYDTVSRTTYPGEIDIILTKTHLITGHNEEMFQFNDFFKSLQESDGKRRLYMNESPAQLLFTILEILLESCFPRLDNIIRKIDTIERHVFSGNEKMMVKEISFVKRDILNFRRTLMPQRSVLESLVQKDNEFIPKQLFPYYQDLIGTNIRLWNTLQNSKETIESLEETNESLLSNKINESMRFITIFTAVLVPTSIYANIASMNVRIPMQENPFGFWLHIIIMILIGCVTLLLFRLTKKI